MHLSSVYQTFQYLKTLGENLALNTFDEYLALNILGENLRWTPLVVSGPELSGWVPRPEHT